eukprot:3994290-Prorocentrum_lima.AAC.1
MDRCEVAATQRKLDLQLKVEASSLKHPTKLTAKALGVKTNSCEIVQLQLKASARKEWDGFCRQVYSLVARGSEHVCENDDNIVAALAAVKGWT